MKKLLLLSLLMITNTHILAEEKDNKQNVDVTKGFERLIEFNGEQKYLIRWINTCFYWDKNHPFSTTSVIRFSDNIFCLQGDILSLQEKDIEDIRTGNYVYVSYYAMIKTRLSNGSYENVGAIILGTTDERVAKDEGVANALPFAHLRNVIKEIKKETQNQ